MVATRRAARREAAARGGGPGPGGAAETASADIGTSVSMRMSSRSKAVRKADVIQESQLEELDRAGTKPDVSNSIEMQVSGNENTAVHSAQPSADPQADGDVSEAESNCSTVSGLQTPLFIRVTRRRQIVVPYQPGSPAKKRHNRTAFPNKLSRTVDEGDISEAESCSSAVSDAYMPNVSKTTRNRQSKKKLQSDPVCEAQSEDVSDAESCCFHTEPSVTARQTTRSVQMKLQAENTQRAEKVSRIVSKTENVIKDTIKSESDLISESSPAAQFNTEVASFVSECNKDPSSPKSKRSLKSANAVSSEDVKQGILNEMTSSSLKKMEGKSTTESPVKKAIADTELVGVDDSEEKSGQMQDEYSEVPREVKLKNMDVCLMDCMSPKLFLESPGEIKPNENNSVPEKGRVGAEAAVQRSSTHASELRKDEQSSAVSSSEKEVPAAQTTGSIVRMAGNSVDSGKDQTRERAEFESCSSERSNGENDSFALFLSKDGSDESENSDATDVGTAGKNLSYTEADESSPSRSLENSLHAEELFVIDTEPGMGSSKKYYLDQVEQGSDVESKHEASEKAEESSDLEEDEEELIDEDEKDEDDDLLKNKIDVSDVNHGNSVKDFLHLSSSIDPGLNIKKLGGLYISFDGKKQKPSSSVMNQLKEKKKDQLLQKSIITPDFERKECVPPFRESLQQLKKQRRAEREKTTGDGWFGMKAPEITSELKNDLKVLKMRASLDPKHFYKKNDRDGLPKYFQVGTVVDSPIDFYHSRIPKKQRKKTIVEELLADSEFRRYNKRKYQEIMSEKAAYAAGKRNRKKKKFHN